MSKDVDGPTEGGRQVRPAANEKPDKPAGHPLRGALKGVTYVPPGVDLTEPACPEWADLLDQKYGPDLPRSD